MNFQSNIFRLPSSNLSLSAEGIYGYILLAVKIESLM